MSSTRKQVHKCDRKKQVHTFSFFLLRVAIAGLFGCLFLLRVAIAGLSAAAGITFAFDLPLRRFGVDAISIEVLSIWFEPVFDLN